MGKLRVWLRLVAALLIGAATYFFVDQSRIDVSSLEQDAEFTFRARQHPLGSHVAIV